MGARHLGARVTRLEEHLPRPEAAFGEQWNETFELLIGEHAHHLAQLAQVPRDRALNGLPPARRRFTNRSGRGRRGHRVPPVPP